MNFSKIKSQYASTSNLQAYKPEHVIPHVVRMQNLLEQYDRQNSYLNKQVMQLLGRKKQFDSRFGLSNRTYGQFNNKIKNHLADQIRLQALSKYPSYRQSSGSKLKRYEYVDDSDQNKSPYQGKFRRTFNTTGRKQTNHYTYTPYQNVEEADRSVNSYKSKYNNDNSNKKAKVNYQQQHNISSNVINKRQISERIPYTKPFFPVQEKNDKRTSPNTTEKNRKDSPEATSRFLNQQQLRITTKQQVNPPITNIQQQTKIINKQPYIGPIHRESSPSPSFTGSPEKKKSITNINESMISIRSNKSRKSGIQVTSPAKSIKIEKKQSQNEQSAQKRKEDQILKQRQKQIERQRQKQMLKEKEKKIQEQTFRQRQRLLQIQKQIQRQKQKQKQRQLIRQKQKQLQKQKQKRRQKQRQLQFLRQKQEQKNQENQRMLKIIPNKVQKTVTFADQIVKPTQKLVKAASYQQNQTMIKFPSTPYFQKKQIPPSQRHEFLQYQNRSPFKPQYESFAPLAASPAQTSSYNTNIGYHNNFLINKSQSLPINSSQIQIPKRQPSQQTQLWNMQEQNIFGRKKSSQHRIEPSQKITYEQKISDLNRKQSSGSLIGNSKDKKRKFIKVVSFDILSSKSGEGQKK